MYSLWCWISDEFPHERLSLEYYWFWTTAVCTILVYVLALAHAYGFFAGRVVKGAVWLGFGKKGGKMLRFILYERRERGVNYRSPGSHLWSQPREGYDLIILATAFDSAAAEETNDSQSFKENEETKDGDSEIQVEAGIAEAERQAETKRAHKRAKLMLLFPTGMSFFSTYYPPSSSRGSTIYLLTCLSFSSAYVIVILPQSIVRLRYFKTGHTSTVATVIGACVFSLSGLFNVLLYRLSERFKFDLGPDPHGD